MLENKSNSTLRSMISGNTFGLKKYDFGGVGLGIVAALDKSRQGSLALCGRNLNRSDPVPVNLSRNSTRLRSHLEELEMDMLEEDYTIVTCHGPNKSYTKVYFDGDEHGRKGDDRTPFRKQHNYNIKTKKASVFEISPARSIETAEFPASDFLSSCHLCQKKLHGKDIYMYRGEKAFCSTECRYRQIVMDERKEKCSSEASRSVEVSNSPYTNETVFSTGILAI